MLGFKIAFTGIARQYNNLREEILETTDTVLSSGQLVSGSHRNEFESWLCGMNSSNHAITCHSGTQALEIIARFIKSITVDWVGIPTVLIPTLTYPATANAFITAGWNIILVDVNEYGIIDLGKIPQLKDFQAVCSVGLYGAGIRLEGIPESTIIIEDAAQHWLADQCRRQYHSGMQVAAISFDPTKNFPAYGNGGAIITSWHALASYAENYRRNGGTGHATIGTNSQMSELECALMMVKAQYLSDWQLRRRVIADYWIERFKDQPIRTLIDENNFDTHSYHKFVIDINKRDDVQCKLTDAGIQTKIHYEYPLHELPIFFNEYPNPGLLSRASALSRRVLSLPIYPELTDSEVNYITDEVIRAVNLVV